MQSSRKSLRIDDLTCRLISQRDIPSSLYFSPRLHLSAPACSILQLIALVPCSLFPLCLLFLHLKSPRCFAHVSYRIFINPPFRANAFMSFCAVGLLSLHYCFLLLLTQGSCYFERRYNTTQGAIGRASGCQTHTATRTSCLYKERKRKEVLRRRQEIRKKKEFKAINCITREEIYQTDNCRN